MANGQRTAARGATQMNAARRQPTAHVHHPVNCGPKGCTPAKALPTAQPQQNRVAGPHINQHSAHLQRVAQAKMVQPRAVNKWTAQALRPAPKPPLVQRVGKPAIQPKLRMSPSPALRSGVVQPAGFCAAVGDFFAGVWRTMTSCGGGSARQEQYEEIPDRHVELGEHKRAERRESPRIKTELCDQEDVLKNLPYPTTINAGTISSCAIIIFCGPDDFDVYHATGGKYKSNHGMRNRPSRIFYVYKSLPTDSSSYIADYRNNAERYQAAAGRPPLIIYGQRDVNYTIWVNVMSESSVVPFMGLFV